MPETQVHQLIDALYGTEQSRRVGWAKFFDTDRAKAAQRRVLMNRVGLVIEIAAQIGQHRPNPSQGMGLLEWFVDDVLTEATDRDEIQAGREVAKHVVVERWGDWNKAFLDMDNFKTDYEKTQQEKARRRTDYERSKKHDQPGDVRCSACSRLLGKWVDGVLQVRCWSTHCKHINLI